MPLPFSSSLILPPTVLYEYKCSICASLALRWIPVGSVLYCTCKSLVWCVAEVWGLCPIMFFCFFLFVEATFLKGRSGRAVEAEKENSSGKQHWRRSLQYFLLYRTGTVRLSPRLCAMLKVH
ncbi:hypothetical protein HOY82DRAFT_550984 [Tuber indicum]|nr:hypothetical protein HOY82DRAFT_550984 [Tuber indicum]